MISSIRTATGTIEFADTGCGIPVLYFHGILSASEIALLIEKPLVDDGFRLIIPHRPGYRGTTVQRHGHTTAADCADMAIQVLDHLGLERVGVIGTSAGGPPATAFSLCYPQRTAALVLQCAQVHRWDSADWLPTAHQWTLPWLKMTWSRWLACCGYYWMCRTALGGSKKCLQGWSGKRYSEIQHDENALNVAESFTSSLSGLRGYYNDMTSFVCDDVLSQGEVNSPTLILHDPLDETVPLCHAEFAASKIPNSKLLKLNLGGHFVWAGRDAALMRSTRTQFLKENIV